MSDKDLHGYYYTTKERDDAAVAVGLPMSEMSCRLVTWMMDQKRLEDYSGRRYNQRLTPLLATDLPQGYFTWDGASCLFIYGQSVDADGVLEEAANAGLHLVEFTPGNVRHAWFDEDEVGPQVAPEAIQSLVGEPTEWEAESEPRDEEFALSDDQQRKIRKNIAWLNELIARLAANNQSQEVVTSTDRLSRDATAKGTAASPQAATAEEETGEPAEEAAEELPEPVDESEPFEEWPPHQQLELVQQMLATPEAIDETYPVPPGEAVPHAVEQPETALETRRLLISRMLPMLLEDTDPETMHTYYVDKLKLSDKQYAHLLKTNLTVARFAAEIIVSRSSREEALERVSKMLAMPEKEQVELLVDNSIEIIEEWPYGKLTASAKILNLADEDNKGCMAWLGLFLLTSCMLLTGVINRLIV